MKKLLVLLPAAMMVLASCGGDTSSSTTGGDSATSSGGDVTSTTTSTTGTSSDGSSTSVNHEGDMWDWDLVEGESSFQQVRDGITGDFYTVRGTVVGNSGSTMTIYRNGMFMYCYNFAPNGGENANLEAHPVGSYVEVTGIKGDYQGSTQLSAYNDGGYSADAACKVLEAVGESGIEPVVVTEENYASTVANSEAGVFVQLTDARYVGGDQFTATGTDNEYADFDVCGNEMSVKLEKYFDASLRQGIVDQIDGAFQVAAQYSITGVVIASSGGAQVGILDSSILEMTAEPHFDDVTEINVYGSKTVKVGSTLGLDIEVLPETAVQTLTAASDDETVATVTSEGVVTGVAEGTANITLTSTSTPSISTTVEVTVEAAAPVTAIPDGEYTVKLDPTNVNLTTDKSETATVVELSLLADTETVTYEKMSVSISAGAYLSTSHDPHSFKIAGSTGVISVSNEVGTITGVVLDHNNFDNANVYAGADMSAAEVTAGPTSVEPTGSRSKMEGFSLEGIEDFIIGNPSSYDADLYAVYFTVLVGDPIAVSSVEITDKSVTAMDVATELQLSASVLPAEATYPSVSWSSSDETKATVSNTGLVSALAAGDVTIKASSTSDPTKFDEITITIAEASFSVLEIDLSTKLTGVENGVKVESIDTGITGLTVTAAGGAHSGKSYGTGTEWRFYSSDSPAGSITVTMAGGIVNDVILTLDSGTFTKAGEGTESVVLTCTANAKVTAIKVLYTPAA